MQLRTFRCGKNCTGPQTRFLPATIQHKTRKVFAVFEVLLGQLFVWFRSKSNQKIL